MIDRTDPDHIFYMVIKKLVGTLNQEDTLYLEEQIRGRQEVAEQVEYIKCQFSPGDLANNFARFNDDKYWEDFKRSWANKNCNDS